MIEKFKNKLKTNGIKGLLIILIKFFLRKIGINYNRYFYLVNRININNVVSYWENHKILDAQELFYQDFLLGNKENFNDQKLKLIKERFNKKSYKAYGVIRDGKLIYSSWISMENLETSCNSISEELSKDLFYLLDAYCDPKFRGQGLHGAMNAYRLIKGYQEGKNKCVVIVLHENKPALKSQLKVGYEIEFEYYVLTIWGKTWTNYNKFKNANR